MEGYGEFKFKNGDFYKGEWKNNKQNGQGLYFWKDGRSYNGTYVKGWYIVEILN